MTHYCDHDPIMQGLYYSRHVEAMTAEGLHSKGAIASELAARDIQIDALAAELASLRQWEQWASPQIQDHATDQARIRDLEAENAHLKSMMRGQTFVTDMTAPETGAKCQHDLLKPDVTVTVSWDARNEYMDGHCSVCGHAWHIPTGTPTTIDTGEKHGD